MSRAQAALIADLVIHNGRIVHPDGIVDASLAILDGRILAIGAAASMPDAVETMDASGLHVLPGAIDVYVHFRDPGYTHKEDWDTGTAAAAFGGVTTVFDMPNTVPAVSSAEALAAKHAIARSKARVDYGLYAFLGEDTIDKVPELVAGGVIGFKLYMGETFGKLPTPSTGAMLEAFEVVAPTGKRISLHAETASIMSRREARLRAAGRSDPLAHIAARPAVVAVEAVSRAAVLAEWTSARIHILHISSAAELRPLAEAKARGEELWEIMQTLWTIRRTTVVLVTHDLKEAAYLANRICIMRAKPGRIVAQREVGFARPRSIETTFTPDFTAMTMQLREAIVAVRTASKATVQ